MRASLVAVAVATSALHCAADKGAPLNDIKQPPRCSLNADFVMHPAPQCVGYNAYSVTLDSIATRNPTTTANQWDITSSSGHAESYNSGTTEDIVRTVQAVPGGTVTVLHTVTNDNCPTHTHTDTATIPCGALSSQFTFDVTWGHTTGSLSVMQSTNPCDTYWQLNLHQYGVAEPVGVMAWWQHNPHNRYERGPFTFTHPIDPAATYYVKHGVWSACVGWTETRRNIDCGMSHHPTASASLAGTLFSQPSTIIPWIPSVGVAPSYTAAGDAYEFVSGTPHSLTLGHSINPDLQFSFSLSVWMGATASSGRQLIKHGQFRWMVIPGHAFEHIHLGAGAGDLIHAKTSNNGYVYTPLATWVCMGVSVHIDPSPGGQTRVKFYHNGQLVGGQEVVVPTKPDYPVGSMQNTIINSPATYDWAGKAKNFHYWDAVVSQQTMNSVCGCA